MTNVPRKSSFIRLFLEFYYQICFLSQAATLTQMLSDLRGRSIVQAGKSVAPSAVSSYSFQNAFFYLQWPDSGSSVASLKPTLTALTKTRRRHKLHPPKQRSKYICVPSDVKEVGGKKFLVKEKFKRNKQ